MEERISEEEIQDLHKEVTYSGMGGTSQDKHTQHLGGAKTLLGMWGWLNIDFAHWKIRQDKGESLPTARGQG